MPASFAEQGILRSMSRPRCSAAPARHGESARLASLEARTEYDAPETLKAAPASMRPAEHGRLPHMQP